MRSAAYELHNCINILRFQAREYYLRFQGRLSGCVSEVSHAVNRIRSADDVSCHSGDFQDLHQARRNGSLASVSHTTRDEEKEQLFV
jgi:hypothetical protein